MSPSRRMRIPQFSGGRRLFLFATLLGVASGLLWALPLRGAVRPDAALTIPWWGEFGACFVAGLLTVEVGGRRRITVSLAEVPLALGLFLVDPLVLMGCYSVGVLLARWTRRGLQPAGDYGNLLLDTLFVAVAVLVFAALHPPATGPLAPWSVLALTIAMLAAGCLLGPAALLTSVGLYRGRLRVSDAVHEFATQTAGTIVSTSLAIVILGLAGSRPWLCVALAAPLLLLLGLHLTAAGARARADDAAVLLRLRAILQGSAPVDDRGRDLLAAIAAAFDAARVELVLTGEQRTTALHFTKTPTDARMHILQSDLSAGELEALRVLDDRHVTVVRAAATDTPLWQIAAERGIQACAVCVLTASQQAQGLMLLDGPPRTRARQQLLLAAASLVGAAAARGELVSRDRRRAGGDSSRGRGGEPRILRGRPMFVEAAATALGRVGGTRRPMALLMIDLDGFMAIRETYGDANADAVLATVAGRLRRHLRRYDVMAHVGGERLGLLLDSLRDRGDAEVVARRMLRTLRDSVDLGATSVTLTASVGIAVVDDYDNVPSSDELMRRADMAAYLAKRQAGSRCVVFDSAARQAIIAAPQTTPR